MHLATHRARSHIASHERRTLGHGPKRCPLHGSTALKACAVASKRSVPLTGGRLRGLSHEQQDAATGHRVWRESPRHCDARGHVIARNSV